jgi:hypothetical protein
MSDSFASSLFIAYFGMRDISGRQETSTRSDLSLDLADKNSDFQFFLSVIEETTPSTDYQDISNEGEKTPSRDSAKKGNIDARGTSERRALMDEPSPESIAGNLTLPLVINSLPLAPAQYTDCDDSCFRIAPSGIAPVVRTTSPHQAVGAEEFTQRDAALLERSAARLSTLPPQERLTADAQNHSLLSVFPARDPITPAPENHAVVKASARSLETHFAAVVVQFLSTQNRAPADERPSNVSTTAGSLFREDVPSNKESVTKILTIELSPKSLGQVTVKMRIFSSRVAIELSVHTSAARSALEISSGKLIEAIRSVGCEVDSCEIKVSSAQPSPDNTPLWPARGNGSTDPRGFMPSDNASLDQNGHQRNHHGNERYEHEWRRDTEGDISPIADARLAIGVYL